MRRNTAKTQILFKPKSAQSKTTSACPSMTNCSTLEHILPRQIGVDFKIGKVDSDIVSLI